MGKIKFVRQNVVEATLMTRKEYCEGRGWTVPADENPDDQLYEVVYDDGYMSMLPKARFEETSRPIEKMTFGMAVEAMKKGKKVCRTGWNGKGMYIWVMPGSVVKGCSNIADPHLADIDKSAGEIRFLGSIRMCTATGDVLTGWLASQTDILSDDWMIVD